MQRRAGDSLRMILVVCSFFCLSTGAANRPQQKTAEQFVDRVKTAMQNDEWGRAKSGIGHALTLKPRSPEANFIAAEVYWHEGARSMAIDALEKAIENQPVYPEAHLLLAQCLADDNRHDRARYEAQVALAQGASGFRAHRLLGELDLAKDDYSAAIVSLETALRYATTIEAVDADKVREQLPSLREFTEKFAQLAELRDQQKGSDIVRPVLLNSVFPAYPDEARALKIQGTIGMMLLITENGAVDSVLVYRHLGHGLDERAMESARKMKFSPATKSGKPIRYSQKTVFEFILR